ncbi:hypothetical protein F5890DRAFT_1531608 [Lentinula detonsa]|uniref:DUF6533 domain-containing protein n=1 Tax=Lentinula detonsa TaxID=2804962 RepID=A0AA38PV29_9AGAR|nr:hypothetical protein F5890DRAFT_1531608 [Lentinula detonsa]
MTDTTSNAAATAAFEHFIKFRMQYSSLAVLYYDYVLTFSDEIRYIWRLRSLTQISTLLYICCRYALPGNLLYLLANTGTLGGIDRCDTWYRIIAALSVMGRASIIIVLGMRTYAMCAQNKFVLAVLLPLGLLIPTLDIIQNLNLSCSDGEAHDEDSQKYELAHTEGNLLSIMIPVYDFIAATITIARGIQAIRKMPRTAKLQDSLYYLMVEQEKIEQVYDHLRAISAITITQSVISFRPVNPSGAAAFIGQINAFSVPVSGLLIARFLLRLRAAQEGFNGSGEDLHRGNIDMASTVRFADRDEFSSTPTTGTDIFASPVGESGHGTTSVSTLRQVINSVMNEFGDDPVERTKDMLERTESRRVLE